MNKNLSKKNSSVVRRLLLLLVVAACMWLFEPRLAGMHVVTGAHFLRVSCVWL